MELERLKNQLTEMERSDLRAAVPAVHVVDSSSQEMTAVMQAVRRLERDLRSDLLLSPFVVPSESMQ